jgi:long-chain fatty acid transport protein
MKKRYEEPAWTFTAGVAYDTSAIKDKDRTVTFAVGDIYHFGLGAQWQVKPAVKLRLTYEYALLPDLSVDQNCGPLAGQVSG